MARKPHDRRGRGTHQVSQETRDKLRASNLERLAKMKREIKFRAWDNDYHKMVHSIVCETFELGISFEGVVIGFSQENSIKDKPAEVGIFPARFTPMQFTGLRDKKGKEIYEKDRVIIETTGLNYRADKIKGTVEFIDGCFTVVFDEPVYDKTLGWMRRNLYVKCFVVNHAIEVIGNIYTNGKIYTNKEV